MPSTPASADEKSLEVAVRTRRDATRDPTKPSRARRGHRRISKVAAVTRGRPVLLLLLLALALPPGALAHSAGDDQYQDPLGTSTTPSKPSTPSTPSQGAQSGGGDTSPARPSQAPKRTRSVPLARTGFDAWIPAAAGLVLLLGGVLLLVGPRRRRI